MNPLQGDGGRRCRTRVCAVFRLLNGLTCARYRVVDALAARYNVGSWLSGGSAKRAVLAAKIRAE